MTTTKNEALTDNRCDHCGRSGPPDGVYWDGNPDDGGRICATCFFGRPLEPGDEWPPAYCSDEDEDDGPEDF